MLYYYVCNAQGDVTEILTSGGATVAWYEYDAWGNVIRTGGNTSVASANPIRYRGYYYDTETGFYYLNSRYYDPEVCRFINADGYVSTGSTLLGYNMFAYCLNNPINQHDPNGNLTVSISVGASFSAFVGGSVSHGICWDSEGNVALVDSDTYTSGNLDGEMHIGTPSIFAGIIIQVTELDTIFDLEGIGASAGIGSVPIAGPVAAGGDVVFSGTKGKAVGGSVSIGVGSPSLEFHYTQSRTVIKSVYTDEMAKASQLVRMVSSTRRGISRNYVQLY